MASNVDARRLKNAVGGGGGLETAGKYVGRKTKPRTQTRRRKDKNQQIEKRKCKGEKNNNIKQNKGHENKREKNKKQETTTEPSLGERLCDDG